MKPTKKNRFAGCNACVFLLLTLALPGALQAQFTYITNSGGTLTIVDAWDNFDDPLIIPSSTNGLQVTHIGEGAFGGVNAPSVVIPDSIVDIGPYAFYNSGLYGVTIGNGVTNIGEWAFAESGGIMYVTFGTNVVTIGEAAFRDMGYLDNIVFPDSVTTLGDWVLADSQYLTNITIGANVTNIGAWAFHGCLTLTNINIPASVMKIGELAFYYCPSLTEIPVDPLNTYYFSSNGVLFQTSPMSLIQYPIAKRSTDYRVPDGVTRIETYAFTPTDYLINITIPASLTSLAEHSFADSWTVTRVTFEGDTPITEGNGAFWGPNPTIYYWSGTSGWSNTWEGFPAFALDAPYIEFTLQPTNRAASSGAATLFVGEVVGSGLFSYQWQFNGANISGATSNIYILSPAVTNDSGTYELVVTNPHGSITSSPAILTVAYEPLITDLPTNVNVFVGKSAVIHASGHGAPPVSYQWRFNGTNINGATDEWLVIPNIQFADAGDYSVVVSNFAGVAISSNVVLTVNPAPPCVTPPAGLISWWRAESSTVDEVGGNTGTIAGTGTVGYAPDWVGQTFVFDGNNKDRVSMGNPTNLQLQNFTIEAWVRRSDFAEISFDDDSGLVGHGALILSHGRAGYGFGLLDDGRMILTKVDWDGVISSPRVTDTNWHHLAVTKSGTNVVFYMDGTPESAPPYASTFSFDNGACSCTAAISIGSRGDARGGSFYGAIDEVAVYSRSLSTNEIQDIYNAAISGKCVNQIVPFITAQPTNVTVISGRAATFRVTAGGTTPLSYQWRLDGNDVAGATSNIYALAHALTNDAGSYTVLVTNSYGSITSSPAMLTVIPDTNRPSVAISFPGSNARITNNPALTVLGTAFDAIGVAEVLYQHGGGAFQLATGTNNWSAALSLTPGANTFRVKSVDWSGNISATNTRTFYLVVTSSFALRTNGLGHISSTVSSLGTPTNGAILEVGRSYTIKALPGTNWLFTNWTASVDGGPTNHASLSASYTFLMQTNLTLVANFVTNRFIAAGGTYYGLFTDEATPMVSFERSGLFTLKTDSKQKFSGSLYLDGNTIGYSGILDLSGHGVSKPVLRKGKAALQVSVELALDGSDSVSGTVAALSNAPSPYVLYPEPFTSAMTGFKATFNLTNNPATNFAGTYTMVIDVPTNTESPKGNGFGLITMKTNGYVTAAGYLGDYATFKSVAVYISKDGDWPLYATAYKGIMPYQDKYGAWKTNKELNGMIWGWMKFTNNTGVPSGRELLDSSVDWIKYPNTNNFYPAGFTNHDLVVFASAYNAPTNANLAPVLNIVTGNVVSMNGNLPVTICRTRILLAVSSPVPTRLARFSSRAIRHPKLALQIFVPVDLTARFVSVCHRHVEITFRLR